MPFSGISRAFVWAALLMIGGCASPVKEYQSTQETRVVREKLYQLEEFQLQGKLGYRDQEEAFSVAINNWKQEADYYEIDLSSTFFGLGAVQISGTAAWIEIAEAGEETIYSNYPSETLESLLRMPLPVQRIRYWIRGVPAPQSRAEEQLDERGLLSSLKQDGWTIDLDRYHDVKGLPLPGRIKLKRDKTRITLAVATWQLP